MVDVLAQSPAVWAADLFTVQTLTFRTLYVLLFIAHDRRELVHLAVRAHPVAAWIWRQLVEATPWGRQPRYLVRDRDRVYGGDEQLAHGRPSLSTWPAPRTPPTSGGMPISPAPLGHETLTEAADPEGGNGLL